MSMSTSAQCQGNIHANVLGRKIDCDALIFISESKRGQVTITKLILLNCWSYRCHHVLWMEFHGFKIAGFSGSACHLVSSCCSCALSILFLYHIHVMRPLTLQAGAQISRWHEDNGAESSTWYTFPLHSDPPGLLHESHFSSVCYTSPPLCPSSPPSSSRS